eukprot:TRINITY_DN37610_c0_g1_i1.p2 TRINITY_DN37610_c0_g1~~TRINITY_DN37610_c0_g1_i1.p2  ORF type:complete len:107 (+),score=8.31 TRINITY_DN37610_c0_g1_i1:188-508(+)
MSFTCLYTNCWLCLAARLISFSSGVSCFRELLCRLCCFLSPLWDLVRNLPSSAGGGGMGASSRCLISSARCDATVSYTHLRAHETPEHLVCRLLLEKKKIKKTIDK